MHPVTIAYSTARVARGGSHTSYSYADPAELLPPLTTTKQWSVHLLLY